MQFIGSVIVAVMIANILTVTFLYGMARAFRIYRDEDLDRSTFLCLTIPLAVMGVGVWVYG